MEDLCSYSTTDVFSKLDKVPGSHLVYLSVLAEMSRSDLPGLRGDSYAPSLAEKPGQVR